MPGEKIILLPMSYLGPLQLYCRFFEKGKVLIEQNDNYQKQTYRSRCDIYSANGRLSLIIPVKHKRGQRMKVKETQIDYSTDWRRLHWKGIVSAYNSSPYFEYYRDTFELYYQKEYRYLIDLCMRLNDDVLKIIGISHKPEVSGAFVFPGENPKIVDLREIIHPKKRIEMDERFMIVQYTQVFLNKHGFIPNLSILDLIFNMGPESGSILNSSLKKPQVNPL